MMGLAVAVSPAVVLVALSTYLAPRVSARAFNLAGIVATVATVAGLMFGLPLVVSDVPAAHVVDAPAVLSVPSDVVADDGNFNPDARLDTSQVVDAR